MEGELFISIPRVKSNSLNFNVHFKDELSRVIIHGVLHLCGYKDDTAKTKYIIKSKEDFYLSLRKF